MLLTTINIVYKLYIMKIFLIAKKESSNTYQEIYIKKYELILINYV